MEASIGQVGQKEVLLITKNDATNFGSVTEIDTQIETEVDDFVTLIVFGKNNLPLVITNPVFVKRGD